MPTDRAPQELTYDQVMEQFGETRMVFRDYYKYSFGFTGEFKEGVMVYASFGGSSDAIYKFSVSASEGKPLRLIDAGLSFLQVKHGDEVLYEYSDW